MYSRQNRRNNITSTNQQRSRGLSNSSTVTREQVSFLFRVDKFTTEFDSEYYTSPDIHPFTRLGYDVPPHSAAAFTSSQGQLFRWNAGVTTAVRGQEIMYLSQDSLIEYDVKSVFYVTGIDRFIISEGDCSLQGVQDDWVQLQFDDLIDNTGHHISLAQINGTYTTLTAPGNPDWFPQLLPPGYNPSPQNGPLGDDARSGGLAGKLSILLSLAAFSCPENWLEYVLTNDQCFQNGRWQRHSAPSDGRARDRGVIVRVFLDPHTTQGSNHTVLHAFENADDGPIFGV